MLKILQVFVVFSAFLAIFAGLLLLVIPVKMMSRNTCFRQFFFEFSVPNYLNRFHKTEQIIYRYHRPIGAIVTIGAAILIISLLGMYDSSTAVLKMNNSMGFWGTHALILVSWLLSIFALAIGVFLFTRPSALKDFEKAANRWIEFLPETPSSSTLADKGLGWLVLRAPRSIGLILIILGLGCLTASLI